MIKNAAIQSESRRSLSLSDTKAEGSGILPVKAASVRLARKPECQHGVVLSEALLHRADKSIGGDLVLFDVPTPLEGEFISPGGRKKSALGRQ